MANDLHLGNAGLSLIKSTEGFRPKTYICPAGKKTLGYGSTGKLSNGNVVSDNMTISEPDAEKEVIYYCETKKRNSVNNLVSWPLKQNQFDALMCITYNLGSLSKCPKLRQALADQNDEEIKNQWLGICKAKNPKTGQLEELGGLKTRRIAEAKLYFSGSSTVLSSSDLAVSGSSAGSGSGSSSSGGSSSTNKEQDKSPDYQYINMDDVWTYADVSQKDTDKTNKGNAKEAEKNEEMRTVTNADDSIKDQLTIKVSKK